MNKNKIRPSDLLELEKKFGNTDWAKDDPSKIEKLARRISLLEKKEKDLIKQLTSRFCYIDYVQALQSLMAALNTFLEKNKGCEYIIVAPLKSPFIKREEKDATGRVMAQKAKSSDLWYAILRSFFIRERYDSRLYFDFCDKPVDIKISINSILKKILGSRKTQESPKENLSNTCKIVLIDDFVGSGNTAVEIITDYLSYLQGEGINASSNQFCVVVIVAMQDGLDYIKSHVKVNSYCSFLKQKEITKRPNADENKKLMESIEKKVLPELNQDYSFGYKKSEALVSIMERAPNNTFPFYWYETKDKKLKPIFRRDINRRNVK